MPHRRKLVPVPALCLLFAGFGDSDVFYSAGAPLPRVAGFVGGHLGELRGRTANFIEKEIEPHRQRLVSLRRSMLLFADKSNMLLDDAWCDGVGSCRIRLQQGPRHVGGASLYIQVSGVGSKQVCQASLEALDRTFVAKDLSVDVTTFVDMTSAVRPYHCRAKRRCRRWPAVLRACSAASTSYATTAPPSTKSRSSLTASRSSLCASSSTSHDSRRFASSIRGIAPTSGYPPRLDRPQPPPTPGRAPTNSPACAPPCPRPRRHEELGRPRRRPGCAVRAAPKYSGCLLPGRSCCVTGFALPMALPAH